MKKSFLRCFVFINIFLSAAAINAAPIADDHPSAYLRAHANDAVHWQQLDASVLQKAKAENKLIFLSSGFNACHWCHVMRKESFLDKQVGTLINRHFIAVKVDREMSPVLDTYLLEFVRQATGRAGWPLNVVLTPEGYPLTGFVYLKPAELMRVMGNLQNKWQAEPAALNKLALDAFKAGKQANAESVSVRPQQLINAFEQKVKAKMDELQGGFGMTFKSPRPHVLMALMELQAQRPQPWLEDFLQLTLHSISDYGLHDMVGGGFFRYTVDPSWHTPHFEKMLFLNAAMVELYVRAYQVLDDSHWLHLADETMGFLLRDMRNDSAEFISSLSAQDAQGVEGGAYLFSQQAIDKLFNQKQGELFEASGEWLHLAELSAWLPAGVLSGEAEQQLRPLLLAEREKNPPVREVNVIKSWNAYVMIAGLALQQVSEEDYRKALAQLAEKLKGYAADDALSLQEMTSIAMALAQWGDYTDDEHSRVLARKLTRQAAQQFRRDDGWLEVSDAVIPLPGRKQNLQDGDLPAADVQFMWLQQRFPMAEKTAQVGGETLQLDPLLLQKPMKYARYIETVIAREPR
ncbi:MAG TPA: DUF255 domain-containing protein [Gammaproteobacteria bacterium]